MCKFPLALVLQAAAIAGSAATYDGNVIDNSGIVSSRVAPSARRRSLSQSLLPSLTKPRPKVDRCWGEMELDAETGEKRPAIKCEFDVPKGHNSTADIKRGACSEFDEPACGKTEGDTCVGPFILSGKMRIAAYPDIHPEEMAQAEFEHTYCARADVYQDTDGSGEQTSVSHITKQLEITFLGDAGNNDEYSMGVEMEHSKRDINLTAAIWGSLIGILIVVACFLMKKRNGGTKIHESTESSDWDSAADAKEIAGGDSDDDTNGTDEEMEIV